MKRLFNFSALMLLSLLLASSTATAQDGSTPKTSSGLIVQVAIKGGRVTYHPVPGSNLFGYRRLPTWNAMDEQTRAATIKLRFTLANDGVRIDITVSHGKFRNDFTPAESYTAYEGKPLLLSDLERFGVEPLEVLVVRLSPKADMSPPVGTSDAPSVEIVDIALENPVLQTYIVSFRNNSKKTLRKLEIKTFRGDALASIGWPQRDHSAIVATPGEVFKYKAFASSTGKMTSDGLVPDRLTKINIVTAIFDDDTFEGDPEYAIHEIPSLRGQKIQLDRVLKLLENASSNKQTDDSESVKNLLKQVDALPIISEPDPINEFMGDHRELFKGEWLSVKKSFDGGLSLIKMEIILDVGKFEQDKYNGSSITFSKWLTDTREQYGRWLASMK